VTTLELVPSIGGSCRATALFDDMSRRGSGSSIMVNLRAVAHSSCQHPAAPRAGDPFDECPSVARWPGTKASSVPWRIIIGAPASRRCDLCARYSAQ